MKIVYMGTPEFAIPALIEIHNQGHEISLVITQKDRPKGRGKKIQYTVVKKKALELGLEVYQPDNINSEESIEKIKALEPDFIIVAAYGQILSKEILAIPKYSCLNIHASLLPSYRGAAPINWAIIKGETETGITIMKMDEGLDSGDMMLSQSIPIEKTDDSESLYEKLANLGGKLIVDVIENYDDFKPVQQNHSLKTYAPMLKKDLGKIDWTKSGKDIANLIRGLKPWPIAYTQYNDESLKIHEASFIEEKTNNKSFGEIIKVSKEGIYVNVKDGYIIIKELQFPGKKRLAVEQYLAGNSMENGIILS